MDVHLFSRARNRKGFRMEFDGNTIVSIDDERFSCESSVKRCVSAGGNIKFQNYTRTELLRRFVNKNCIQLFVNYYKKFFD